MDANEIIKTGPVKFKGVRNPDLYKKNPVDSDGARLQAWKKAAAEASYREAQVSNGNTSPGAWTTQSLYTPTPNNLTQGASIFDDGLTLNTDESDIAEMRANNQPWYAQIGAGLAKGALLAGTTFLDGTIGLAVGTATAINEGRFSGLWDNDFSKAMQIVTDVAEKELPNYYTHQELEGPWYENIFTANFIGDKFIKNSGFMVGAFYSGNLGGSLLSGGIRLLGATARGGAMIGKAANLAKTMHLVKDVSKFPKMVTSAVGSTISAVNEGRVEALNNSRDWFYLNKAQLDDAHKKRLQALQTEYEANAGKQLVRSSDGETTSWTDPAYTKYQQALAKEKNAYNQALVKLSEDRLKMGNADLLMNIPILTVSNMIQFGKLYANGFKSSRKALNIVGKAGETKSGTTRLGRAWSAAKVPLSEGTEEILQRAASEIAGDYYSTDVNNFYKAKIDPKAEQETLSVIKSFAKGINETVNDGSAWEEFFIGSLMGALGMPTFRGIKNSEGNYQSPITLRGGVIGALRVSNEKKEREDRIAAYMNNRVRSPQTKAYYQGLIRHTKYQNTMNQSAEKGDKFSFNNAEHGQLVSDVAMFDNAGRMEDYYALIDEAFDTSDENLASIVKNTSTTLEDGTVVGPFVDKKGNPMYSTPEGKQEMIKKINKNKEEMLNAAKNYLKIKDEIDTRTGQQLSDDQLEELTWMKSQIGNWKERAVTMSGEVRSGIGKVLGNLDSLLRFNQQVRTYEGQASADLTDTYKQADKNVGTIQRAIDNLKLARSLNDESFVHALSTNPKFVKSLIEEISGLDETTLNADQKEDIITKINDLVKIGNASETYNAKLKEYLQNPQKQAEDHARADEQTLQQEASRKAKNIRDNLNAAQNMEEFRAAIEEEEDTETVDKILSAMEDEGSEMAKNYRETSQYNNEVKRVLDGMEIEPEVKQDALQLLQAQFSNSENLEEAANPNSIYINNENAFDEDSEGDAELSASRFQKAQYALQSAMSKVNSDNKFKDRFSPEYRKPAEKREGVIRGDDRKDTTGDSSTATTPVVTETSETLPTEERPVGDITKESVAEENKETNKRADTPPRPQRGTTNKFYRPAIPEIHIEASKEGDFRPFDVVVGEREKGADFSEIYHYLRDNGAFNYVNAAKLKPGDELGFMIDPEFNDHTIFIVDTRNNQIVGSLDESDYSISRYEGLEKLIGKLRKEYQASKKSDAQKNDSKQPKTKRFYASPRVKVSKVMVGKIPYSSEERSLKDIPKVQGESRQAVFGIVKNGTLTTNGKIDDSLIIKPLDMSQKEGRLYLLIPNGAGKYSPAAVRVKHFNNTEFNLDDATVASTLIGEDIKGAIEKLSNASSQDDVSAAMQELSQDLHMQDVMVSWFTGNAGNGIVISKKIRKPDGTYEKVTIDGKEQIKEEKHTVYFTTSKKSAEIGGLNFDAAALEELGDASALGTPKDPNDIYREILDTILRFNLPLQVSARRINNGAYNSRLINSDILTSNITNAIVRGSWFTTDYFDNEGNLHKAINPAPVVPQPKRKVETPVGGTEGAITGTKITFTVSNKTYYVDLKTNTIRDDQGRRVEVTKDNRILFDLAWAQDNFGDATVSSVMVDNKVLTPSGRVLDRSKEIYLEGKEAQDVKDAIAGRRKEREDRIADSKKVISEIYENQKRVDKDRTDGESYYILEDDGQYHKYSRVHSRLGSNRVDSPKQTKTLAHIRLNLSRFTDSPSTFNNYLGLLEKKYKISLKEFVNKTDVKTRDTIVNIVRDAMSSTNSQVALNAGTAVDSIIRQYFTLRDTSKIEKPSNMSESAFIDLITTLNNIKSNMEQMGERFLADNIVLFQKYADSTRVAGEVDILSVDKDGNFRIYDVKTSRYSFHPFVDKHGNKVNYFENKSDTQRISTKDYYTLQLSAYKNLFESQYGVPVTKLAIMPFVLSYDKEKVSTVQKEKGIPIIYNPAVSVPLASAVKVDKAESNSTKSTSAQSEVMPIFETSLETQSPIEDLTPEHKSTDKDKVGYFEMEGKLHKGYITPLTTVDGIEVYMTKVPNITKGFGRQGEAAHVASNSYYVVFPNGKTFLFVKNNPVKGGMTQSQVEDAIKKGLEAKPQKVKDLAVEKTLLFNPKEVPTVDNTPITTEETSSTIHNTPTQKGAAYTAQREAMAKPKNSKYRRKFHLVESGSMEQRTGFYLLDLTNALENKYRGVTRSLLKLGWSLADIDAKLGTNLKELAGYRGTLWESMTLETRKSAAATWTGDRMLDFSKDYAELGLSLDTDYDISEIESLVSDSLYKSPLFQKVISVAKTLGVKVKFGNRRASDTFYGYFTDNTAAVLVSPKDPNFEHFLLHELIHSATLGALKNRESLTKEQRQAIDILEEVYNRTKKELSGEYGATSIEEFIAELSNPQFREKLKRIKVSDKVTLWDKIKEFFKKLFNNALDVSDEALNRILDNPIKATSSKEYNVHMSDKQEYAKVISSIRSSISSRAFYGKFENGFMFGNEGYIYVTQKKGNKHQTYYYRFYLNGDTGDIVITRKIHDSHTKKIAEDMRDIEQRNPRVLTHSNANTRTTFNMLSKEVQDRLLIKGWTVEKFNSISQEERDHVIKCVAF